MMLPAYAELHALSNFSFQRGASHPQELVQRAHALGYSALALTDECSVAGVVRAHGAAQALGLGGDRGTLEPGGTADFAIWNIGGPEELGYWTGFNPCRAVVRAGEVVHGEVQRGH